MAIGARIINDESASDLVRGEYAMACITAGQIAAQKGQAEMAREFWQRAADAIRPVSAGSNHWRILDPAARIHALLGRRAQSNAIVEQLRRLGYEPLEP